MSSARTKTATLIAHDLALFSVKQIVEEVSEIHFYNIATDDSDHKAIKAFPLVLKYFDKYDGIQYNLLT